MDKLAELSHGAKVVLGAAIALLVFSFFDWFQYADIGFANMWNGIGVLAGLLLIALIVWQAIRLANINTEVGVTPSMVTAALSVLLVIFVAIRFLDKPGPSIANEGVDRTIWAWLGLILAIVIVVGAWMNMRAAGEGLADVRDRVSSMTAGSGSGSAPAAEAPAQAPPAPPSTGAAADVAADEGAGAEEPPKPA
jgi:amino acid transporter